MYDILSNDNGEIIIIIEKQDGEPQNSRFYLDEENNSLCIRRHDKNEIELKNISEEEMEILKSVSQFLIIEIEDEEVVYEYNARKMEPIR